MKSPISIKISPGAFDDRQQRICAAENLDVGQGKRRAFRQYQPTHRGAHARQGSADRQASAPALFARYAQWREGHGDEIGRASCRERVCQYVEISVVDGSLKKKKG